MIKKKFRFESIDECDRVIIGVSITVPDVAERNVGKDNCEMFIGGRGPEANNIINNVLETICTMDGVHIEKVKHRSSEVYCVRGFTVDIWCSLYSTLCEWLPINKRVTELGRLLR